MNVNPFPALHFLHIGKTGGTAVKHALTNARLDPSAHLHLHNHGTRLADVPAGERAIFFLRDPIARFVSGFLSRQRHGMPRYNFPWSEAEALAFARFKTANELAVALSSDERDLRNQAAAAMQGIQHVRHSIWHWLGTPEKLCLRGADIFFIGQQEHLADDVAVLAERLKLPQLELPSDDVESHRNPPNLNRALEPRAIANLRRWYTADYEAMPLCGKIARDFGLGGSIAKSAEQSPSTAHQARIPTLE